MIELMNKNIYEGLYETARKIYLSLFNTLNSMVTVAGDEINQPLEQWNGGVFEVVRNASEQVLLPIGAFIMIFMLIIRILKVVEGGNISGHHNFESLGILLAKFLIFFYIWLNSFKMMNFVFSIGQNAGYRLSNVGTSSIVFRAEENFDNFLLRYPANYDIGAILDAIMVMGILIICYAIATFSGVAIYFIIVWWYFEAYIYLTVAPIPLAFLPAEDWQETGFNYIKMIFTLGFRPFFALLILLMFGGILSFIGKTENIYFMLLESALAGTYLYFMIKRVKSITQRIINAA